MAEPTIFLATPLHDNRVHVQYMAGVLQALTAFAGRIRVDTQTGSFLPRSRDLLTSRFLDSPASHMLCVDSDIGWAPADAQKLLDSGKEFVSGCYAKKQPNREIPARLTGETDGSLRGCEFVPGGFLLLARECVERMVGAYRQLTYNTPHGVTWALWQSPQTPGHIGEGEDVAFCRRWREIGGQVWLHAGVVVRHYGEACYDPDVSAL